jgi:lipoprotein-anchoring transpeptidase ErfK/SrfK
VQANRLANPNRIEVGQRLVIPGCGATAHAPAPAPAAPGASQVVHVVQPGETLSTIAARYRVSVAALVQANRLANPNRIEVGQRLVIPTGGVAVARPSAPGTTPRGPKRIEVDLARQWMYAYEGSVLVLTSGVSTGRDTWDTPPGNFAIYAKLPKQTMDGEARGETWRVEDVPHVMYFYRSVALHGTYWHNAFGSGARLSHGCVNLPLDVAEVLYDWAPIGTPVRVY